VNPDRGARTLKEVIVPIRDGAPSGAPCWIDLTTSDIDRAREFYGTVFGWTFESAGPEYGGYINVAKDGHRVAGLMANRPEFQSPDNWATYFHTADIYMGLATDPSSAFFGLWQPLEHRGFEVIGLADRAGF
jgi:catechol 2,3-dioxygenase-like lactoylglutathione lyase family enzyme